MSLGLSPIGVRPLGVGNGVASETGATEVIAGTGALALAGHAPAVDQSDHRTVTPAPGALTISGNAPSVTQSSGLSVTPGAGTLALSGNSPTVAQSAHRSLEPAAAALAITGHAPAVSQSQPPPEARYARPASTVIPGAWLPSSGDSLAAMLDEPSADSTDFIYTNTPGTVELALNPVVDPGTSKGQVVRYQASSETGNGLIVKLKQGDVDIAEWRHAVLPSAPTVFAQPLTAPQCDCITDYADLRLSFEAF